MTDKEYYAHCREGKPLEDWHRVEDHLKKVAEMARRFANDFNGGDRGYLAGLTHRSGIERERGSRGVLVATQRQTWTIFFCCGSSVVERCA